MDDHLGLAGVVADQRDGLRFLLRGRAGDDGGTTDSLVVFFLLAAGSLSSS